MKIFKEIEAGPMGKGELIQRMSERGIQFNTYAELLFENPSFQRLSAPQTFKLVKLKLREMDLDRPTIYDEIVKRAQTLGLQLCPLILAAYLRLEYLDQPEGPYLKIASPKVGETEDEPRGLYLRNLEGTLWLRGYRASDDWEYSPEMEFIFQR